MTAATANETPAFIDKESGHGVGQFTGMTGRIVFLIAVAFSLFQVYTAAFNPVSSQILRSLHVGFLLLLTFILFRFSERQKRDHVPWYDWLFAIGGFALGFYHWVFEADLIQRAGDPILADIVVGSIVVILIFEGARRIMGWELPLMCAVFIPYALWGRSLPSFMMHRGFDFDQVIDTLYLGTEGVYGTPTFVSATYIFLFILFGAFLERAGMIDLFNKVALGTVGHQKGGPAKVAVISSGFMGTINGSGVANVLTVGQFTIPLMIKFGYRPAFAGAVEACASMGGQIMPPVMGAVAFIMAETIGVPYSEIALAAVIPAMLYFGSAFWMVHLEAGRQNLVGIPKSECPSAWQAIKEKWYLALPLVVLVFMLFHGFTPLLAGVVGLALTATLILGAQVTSQAKTMVMRILFWLVLGFIAAGLYKLMGGALERACFLLVAVLVVGTWFIKGGVATQKLLLDSMADAAKSALGVGMACALVGVLIGIAQLTGLANDIARGILAVAGDNLLLALVMTMVACIILGTGLPTIPNYIITSAMAAPVLLEMGVPLIVSHMFCFYFGIMADLTPPVALAALAAQSIAKAPHMTIGWIATKIGLAGYVVPFMAVYTPALMLQGGTWFDTTYVLFKALVSVGLWGGAASAWLIGRMGWPERIVATAAAFFLVVSIREFEIAGFALAAGVLAYHWWKTKKATPAAA
ncbi:TRAP transporter permease [Ferrovibrio sp.]|jgi:TRAP transporter 4TM/12TM fusion protein|uniref:TRAP transporter permease n=1 Tax=Ferrovibrio sp. TaxID=1917215 RepID=UPI0035AF75ED